MYIYLQMVNTYMQRCSTSPATRERQSKVSMRYHFTPNRMFTCLQWDWDQHYQGTGTSVTKGQGDGRGLLHGWLQGGKWSQSLWKIISIY